MDKLEVKTLDYTLKEKVDKGEMTIYEAAREFHKHGWTNFVDEEYTKRRLILLDKDDEWMPQEGDFVVFCHDCIAIFWRWDKESGHYAHAAMDKAGLMYCKKDYFPFSSDYMRPATAEEKERLLQELHRNGQEWDPINKELILKQ